MKKQIRKIATIISVIIVWAFGVNAQVNLSNGLLAHLPLNNSGTDVSGNGNNATLSNTGIYHSNDRYGNSANASLFNGAFEQGMMSFATPLLNSRTEFSMSFWFNPSSLTNGMSMVGQDNILETGFFTSPTRVSLYHPTSGTVNINLTSGAGVWQNIIVMCSATQMKYYLNGTLVNTLNGNYTLGSNTTTTRIGGNVLNQSNNSWFRGSFDDVRFYTRILTDDEIAFINNSNPNTIAINSISSSNICAGSSFTVNYTATGDIYTGNEYILQLSNASGSFAKPFTIGKNVSSALTGTLNVTIPAGMPSGTDYKLRILSTNTASVGDTSASITIKGMLGDIPSSTTFSYIGSFEGKEYYLSNAATSFTSARAICASNGGHLTTVYNAQHNMFLHQNITNSVYIGYTDEAIEGTWVWENGTPNNYTNWSAGEPNNSGNEDYAAIVFGTGKWNDATNGNLNYIMELAPAGIDKNTCSDNSISLSAATLTNAQYSWTGPNSFSNSTQSPTISNATVSMSGNYILTYTLNGCAANDTIGITVNQTPINIGQTSGLLSTLNSNLIVHLPMNNNATDVSGNGNNGAIIGGVTGTEDRFRNVNSALAFNGSNGYIDMPDDVFFNGNPFSVSAWVRVNTYANWSRVFDFGNGAANNVVTFTLTFGTNGRPVADIYQNNTSVGQINSNTTVPTNQWANLVYTWANGQGSIYLNGVRIANGAQGAPLNVVRTINYIGRSNWAADAYTNGRMDDFRIYSKVLSTAEIQSIIMQSPKTLSALATPSSICTGNTTQIKLINSQIGVRYQLRNATTLANIGATQNGNGDTLTFTTGALTATTSFDFVATAINNNCSIVLTPTVVTVNALPTPPTAINDSICNSGILTVGVSGATSGSTYNWYAGATGTTLVSGASGASYTTPLIKSTMNFYVSITDNNGCESARTLVTAKIKSAINPPVDIISNLIMYHKLDNNYADSSGNGYNATPTGSITFVNDRNGNATSAINSTSSTTPGSNQLSFGNPQKIQQLTNQITISMWIKHQQTWFGNSDNGFMSLMNKFDGSNGIYMGLNMYNASNFQNRVRWRINSVAFLNSNTNVPMNQWHHVVCTYNGSQLRIYQNGVLTGTLNYTGNIDNTGVNLLMGGRHYSSTGEINYRGDVDQIRVYNRALNISEVQTLHNNESVAFATTPLCDGEGNLALTTFNFPNATYLWNGPNGFTSTDQNPTVINNATISQHAGNYTLKVTVNGCTSPDQQVNVVINPIPTAPITTNDTVCGSGNAVLTASGTPSGGTYSWYTAASGGTAISGQSGPTLTINSVTSNTIRYVSAISKGCEGPRTQVTAVYYNNALTNLIATGSTICSGTTSANVFVQSSESGVKYQAFSGTTAISSLIDGGGNIAIPVNTSGLSVGNNTITIKANYPSCGPVNLTDTATVKINALPTATISASGATTFCSGNSVTLTASSGSSYLWNNNSTDNQIVVTTGGTYSVTVTDANGCSKTSSNTVVTVNTTPTPAISAGGATTFCQGGSVTLSASGGTTYTWSTGATGANLNVNASGNYHFTAFNGSCSAVSSSILVTVNSLPTITSTPNSATICNGNSTTLNTSGALTYTWSPATGLSGTSGSSVTASPSSTQTYTITGFDANNCSNTKTVLVTVNNVPNSQNITAGGATSFCSGGSVSLSVPNVSGVTYQWKQGTTNVGTNSNTFTASNAGVYTVELTNSCGTTVSSNSITVTITGTAPTTPSITAGSTTTICAGDSVLLSVASQSGVTYQWKRGTTNVGTNSNNYYAKVGGTYTIMVSSNCGSANSTNSINVNVTPLPTVPTVSASGNTNICPGNSVALSTTAQSGMNYQWKKDGAEVGTNSNTFAAELTGTYTVVVSNSCGSQSSTNSISVVLGIVPQVQAITTTGNNTFCNGDSVLLSVPVQADVNYQWKRGTTNVGTNSTNYYAKIDGNYSVVITSTCGTVNSSNSIPVTVLNIPTIPTITITGNSTFCGGSSATLSVGSQTDVSYQWKKDGNTIGTNSNSLVVTDAGVYTVELTNSCGIVVSANSISITISGSSPNIQEITANGATTICEGESVTLSVPFENDVIYQWKRGTTEVGTNTNSFTATIAGTYSVTISNNCGSVTSSNTQIIVVNPLPEVNLNITDTLICSSQTAFELTQATPAGGIYYINGNPTNLFNPSSLGVGSHVVSYVFADGNQCENSDSKTIIIDNCTALISGNFKSDLVTIFPNPTLGKITIEVEKPESNFNLLLKDINGRILKTATLSNLENEFDLSEFPAGIYFLHINSNDKIFIEKIIKQ